MQYSLIISSFASIRHREQCRYRCVLFYQLPPSRHTYLILRQTLVTFHSIFAVFLNCITTYSHVSVSTDVEIPMLEWFIFYIKDLRGTTMQCSFLIFSIEAVHCMCQSSRTPRNNIFFVFITLSSATLCFCGYEQK